MNLLPIRLNGVTPAGVVLAALVLIALATAPVAAAARSISPVEKFSDGSFVPGASSMLVRSATGVSMTIQTSQLPAGDALTVWWVIFNNPALCNGPCDGGDVDDALGGNLGLKIGLLQAAGHVIGANGVGNFAGSLQVGDTSGCQSSLPASVCHPLMSASGAVIHLVIRTHGQPIPGMVNKQIGSFDGGCSINVCENLQAAVHEP